MITWFTTYLIFKFSSLSSIIGSLIVPIYIYIFDGINNVYFFLIMFVLIFYTHRENIKRLINKEENKTKIY
jgi:glycerol-3-phosphate acyltransferase PlsY